jgi:ABC-type glycerol-3-phosphate transport system permease component
VSRAIRSRRGSVAANVTGLIVFVLFVFPVYWMVSTAFKQPGEIRTFNVSLIPRSVTLDNFRTAIHAAGFWTFMRNSLAVSLTVTVLAVFVALLAATAVARFRFRGRRTYLLMILVVQMVPLEALVIPMYLTLRDADLLNIVPALIATYMAFVLPFTVWTLRGFVAALPVELEEAAMIDGARGREVFRYITLPLLGPTIRISVFLSIIGALQLFDLVWVMTGGGPVDASNTMAVYMIDWGFKRFQFGYASSVAVIMLAISLLIALLYQRFVLRRDLQGALTTMGR